MNKKMVRGCRNSSKEGIAFLVGLLIVLLLVFGGIKCSWILWSYIVLSLILTVGTGWYILRLKKKQNDDSAIKRSQRETELESVVRALEEEKMSFENQISSLKKEVETKNCLIKELQVQKYDIPKDNYVNLFTLLQTMDKWVEGLPDSVQSYIDNTKWEISATLSIYGYRFVEFVPANSHYYNCERCSIDVPKIAKRAIVTNNGAVVVKGHAFIPHNYGRDEK